MNALKKIAPLIVIFYLAISCVEMEKWIVRSPSGEIEFELFTHDSNLYYKVFLKTEERLTTILDTSQLGLRRLDSDFKNLKILEITYKEGVIDEYELVKGKKKKLKTVYNQLTALCNNKEGKRIDILVRAYNEGVAFSYRFPEASDSVFCISEEYSSFNLQPGKAWMHPYDTIADWAPAYETYYESAIPIGQKAPEDKNGWGFPVLFNSNNTWLLVSESGLDGSYVASHLETDGKKGEYGIVFPLATEAKGNYSNISCNTLPWQTPWRFVTISSDIASIVESNMVTHLATPAINKDFSWVKPGRASWSWCLQNDSPQDHNKLLPFINLASQMNWEYSLIDANWNMMKNGNIEELIKYAATKNVGLMLWYNSGGTHNVVTEAPRDLMDDRRIRREEFKRIHELGIKGVKIDFFQSDKQPIIKQYLEILEDAADYQLLVNFHGCTLPKGWHRTFPNLMTMEAIKGGECYIFADDYPEMAPEHISTIPFLRGVVGSTDYTPGGFSNNVKPHLTSLGFELALPIIIESGLTHYVERPEGMKLLNIEAIQFLQQLPTTWDETKYLGGYPGESAVIARKHGNTWYVGLINAKNETHSFDIDLSPLNIGEIEMSIIEDEFETNELVHKAIIVEDEAINLKIKPYGGAVFIIN